VLNPGGAALLYATYAGGDNSDLAYGVAVAGSVAYLVGETSSADFPTTPSGYDTTCGSNGVCDTASGVPYADAFLLKIDRNPSDAGSLVYGTYLGGLDTDVANAVAASGSQATVAGYTFSSGFPGGGFAGETDAFATRINTAVSGSGGLLYSRLTGGAAYDEARAVALDASGNALIAGETRSTDFPGGQGACNGGGKDGFLSRVTPSGSINYSACIGGSAWDYAQGVAVGPDGLVSLAGYTRSTDFPTTPGAFDLALTGPSDMFAARLDLNLSPALVYATYLGGMDDDEAYGVSVAPDGNAYIGGITEMGGYPTTSNAFDVSYNGGTRDAVLAVLTLRPTGNLQITKIVNWNGVTPPASRNFNICITGPSYLGGNCKDFTYPDGLVQTWANLIPGQYAVTETNPGSQWQVEIAGSPAAVPGDGALANASVKNTRLPDKPPQPPVVIISASVPDAVLTWAPVTQDVDGGDIVVVKYQVWRSTQPYFNPAGLPLAEVLAPTVTFTDVGALADTSTNYYYVVRAVSEAGLTSADSNRTGEFVFDLVKGS
jgi:hypothetical protein